jgi:acyl-coenzyme A synthetase/AMP-(fatty) acid ligase
MSASYNAAEWLVDRHVAGDAGSRIALVCGDETLTYTDLQREIWRAQHALDDLGLVRGERVVLVINDEPAFVAWFLGGLRSGVVPVPLSTMLIGDDLGAIVADAEARAIVLSAEYAGHLPAISKQAPELSAAVVIGSGDADPIVDLHTWSDFDDVTESEVAPTTEDSPAFWLYSSGTTGTPKGVMHRHWQPAGHGDDICGHCVADPARRSLLVGCEALLRIRTR